MLPSQTGRGKFAVGGITVGLIGPMSPSAGALGSHPATIAPFGES